jgi:hypothetical protein
LRSICSHEEVRQAYRRLAARAAKAGITLDGIYMQTMVKGGIEIIVSAFRDPIFGVMISCGAGGNMTEIIEDVALARAPLDHAGATALLRQLRIVRNSQKLDATARVEDLATFVEQFSEVASVAPWQDFVIEINPVKWRSDSVTAVDGLILIDEP